MIGLLSHLEVVADVVAEIGERGESSYMVAYGG